MVWPYFTNMINYLILSSQGSLHYSEASVIMFQIPNDKNEYGRTFDSGFIKKLNLTLNDEFCDG